MMVIEVVAYQCATCYSCSEEIRTIPGSTARGATYSTTYRRIHWIHIANRSVWCRTDINLYAHPASKPLSYLRYDFFPRSTP